MGGGVFESIPVILLTEKSDHESCELAVLVRQKNFERLFPLSFFSKRMGENAKDSLHET